MKIFNMVLAITSCLFFISCVHQSHKPEPIVVQGLKAYYRGDYATAFKLFSEGAADKDPLSICQLGLCFELGAGVPRDIPKAIKLYTQSAELGNPYAWRSLGVCNRDGIGMPPNPQTAITCFSNAINGGVTIALTDLGAMYMMGYGTPTNKAMAAHLYIEAANRGDPLGKQNLGEMYYFGNYFPQDQAEACRRIVSAADDGFIPSIIWVVALSDAGNTNVPPVSSDHIWRKQIQYYQLQDVAKDLTSVLAKGDLEEIDKACINVSRRCYYYCLQK